MPMGMAMMLAPRGSAAPFDTCACTPCRSQVQVYALHATQGALRLLIKQYRILGEGLIPHLLGKARAGQGTDLFQSRVGHQLG
jgi:hypothetical protein